MTLRKFRLPAVAMAALAPLCMGGCGGGGGSSVQTKSKVVITHNLGIVMPLGDSITEGHYRRYLLEKLNANGYGFTFAGSQTTIADAELSSAVPPQTHHEGHAGYRNTDIDANLDGLNDNTTGYPGATNNGGFWLTGIASGPNQRPAIYPDYILLHNGTNDISFLTPPDQVRDSLRSLILHVITLRPAARLLVASCVPRTDSDEPANVAYDALIPALLQEPEFVGAKITFVDMHSKLSLVDILDGLHPTDTGYAKMADAWAAAMMQ